jgi:uncharacterized iron-regulated protein
MKLVSRYLRTAFCWIGIAVLTACAQDPSLQQGPRHPLAGKVWDVSAQKMVSRDWVAGRALNARFVLLGEIHDDAEHHQLQTLIFQAMVSGGRRPALVMEQFDTDQQGAIDTILNDGRAVSSQLQGLSVLMRKSWNWPVYEPIVRIALQNRVPVVAANLSREALRNVGREGYGALGLGEEARLALGLAWTSQRQAQMVYEIAEGHCGKLSAHLGEVISKSQRARDAVIADTLLKFQDSGAVAILGRNHARQDMGVPLYLATRAPDLSVTSIGFSAVAVQTDATAYSQGALGKMFDYVWFTSPVQRLINPCDSIPAPALPTSPVTTKS